MIKLTDNAINEAKRLLAKEQDQNVALRVRVRGGGCSGMFYGLEFDKELPADNSITLKGLKVIIDPVSLPHLEGSTVDFKDGLEERGFKFDNPNAKGCCGCGESFCPKD